MNGSNLRGEGSKFDEMIDTTVIYSCAKRMSYLLIVDVCHHPIIYDKGHKTYRNMCGDE